MTSRPGPSEVDEGAAAAVSAGRTWSRDDLLEWVIPAVVALGLAGVLVASSTPGWWFVLAFLSVGVVVAGLIMWVVRVVVDAVATRPRPRASDGGPDRRTGSNAVAAMAVVPVLVVGVGCAVVADLPLRARWWSSRPAFDDVVRSDQVVAPYQGPSQRIGTYEIRGIERVGGDVLFTDADGGFMGSAGFAHLPNGPGEGVAAAFFLEAPTFVDLGDGWYASSASF